MSAPTRYIENFFKKVQAAGPTETLASVARRMEEHNVGTVVIVENQRPVGIVTDRDLALELGARGTSLKTPVVQVMTTPVETAPRDVGVFGATQAMRDLKVRRLVIVDDDGFLAGIVTLDDLLRMLSREMTNLSEGIKEEMEVN